MKKYTGTKTIKAEPMELGWYRDIYMRDPYANDTEKHDGNEPGYHVVYEDGYSSWSPAEAFEKAYKPSETYVERMEIELDELSDRLDKLQNFMNSPAFEQLDYEQKKLMLYQETAMVDYQSALRSRIKLANTEKLTPQKSLGDE